MTKKKKVRFWGYLLCGIILAISQAIRSEAVVWLLAIICLGVYEWLIAPLYHQRRCNVVIETLLVIIAYSFTLSIISTGVEVAGLGNRGISNNCPYWYVVCGFTPENYGEYSTQYAYVQDTLDPQTQRAAFIQIMKEIIGGWNVKSFFTFWVGKMYRMWGADNGPWAYGLDSSTWMQLMLFLNRAIYVTAIAFSFVGIRMEKTNKARVLLTIAFLGFFCVFLLKEISVKYRYNPGLCLLLLSAFGISKLAEKLKARSNKDCTNG